VWGSPKVALQVMLLIAVLGVLVFLGIRVVPTYARRPWDFETYWCASTAAVQGMNPYDSKVLERLAERPVGMPFLYPPVVLPLLMPLTSLPIEKAAQLWFVFKALLLVPLVLIWQRHVLPSWSVVGVAAVAVFGFNGACVWDLRAGNIAILEQSILWGGFAAYALERRRLFAVCVVAASLFKLVPVVFLALLLVPSRTSAPRWRLAIIAFALFLFLAFAPTAAGFPWARDFLRHLPAERPWGFVNPSALGIIDTLLGDHTTPLTDPPYTALALWAAYAAALVGLSTPALIGLWRRRDPKEWVLAGAMLYALLAPRMMVYSYLLVIVPVLGLIGPIASRIGGPKIVAVILCGQAVLMSMWSDRGIWTQNFSFLVLLASWLVYLYASPFRALPGRGSSDASDSRLARRARRAAP
jgi:hypothetical protein